MPHVACLSTRSGQLLKNFRRTHELWIGSSAHAMTGRCHVLTLPLVHIQQEAGHLKRSKVKLAEAEPAAARTVKCVICTQITTPIVNRLAFLAGMP
eukprot:1434339-Amphidinium_carterae.2